MTRPAPIIAGILAALLLLFVAYMGSYYTMLDPKVLWAVADGEVLPVYRISGELGALLDAFYRPAHKLDKQLRQDRWPDSSGFPSLGDVIIEP